MKCAKFRQLLMQVIKPPLALSPVGLPTPETTGLGDPFIVYNTTGVKNAFDHGNIHVI